MGTGKKRPVNVLGGTQLARPDKGCVGEVLDQSTARQISEDGSMEPCGMSVCHVSSCAYAVIRCHGTSSHPAIFGFLYTLC